MRSATDAISTVELPGCTPGRCWTGDGYRMLYLPRLRVFDAYKNATRLLGIEQFPTIPVLADVCRDSWLVEIEAMAVV
jgi:hypothetical protein